VSQTRIKIRRPSNLHDHGREKRMLKLILKYIMSRYKYVTFMPNLKKAIRTLEQALRYLEEIQNEAAGRFPHCTPLITIQITEETTVQIIEDAIRGGIFLAKMYIRGVTTNSDEGVRVEHILDLLPVFRAMSGCMILLIHCEVPPSDTSYCLTQETDFLPHLKKLRTHLPELKIVVEHVTSATMIGYVVDQDPALTAATITPPHMMLSVNDIIGARLWGDHFCRPPAKLPSDRDAIHWYISQALKYINLFLGTDSAAHPWWAKHVADCCAGIFSDICGLETTAEVFELLDALEHLEAFASLNGPRFYGLPLPEETDTITLVKDPWKVPELIHDGYDRILRLEYENEVIRRILIKDLHDGPDPSAEVALAVNCFRGGQTIPWRVEEQLAA